jgi:hypothetical protein
VGLFAYPINFDSIGSLSSKTSGLNFDVILSRKTLAVDVKTILFPVK